MVFSGVELKDTFAITNAYIGTTQAYEIDVQAKAGISHIMLEVGVIPVGLGTLTLNHIAPFGFIAALKITDQNGVQLGLYTGYELVLLHQILGRNNVFKNVQFNDGTTGWSEVPNATTVASGEELKGTLHLPIRIGRAKNISKIKFEITFNTLNSTTGLRGVGEFTTSFTSVTGSIRASPVFDDSIVETWFSHLFTKPAVSTSFAVFNDPPRTKKIRYALVVLPDFWTNVGKTEDNETLFDQFEFRKDTKITPVRMTQHTMRYMLQDLLDSDPEFTLVDQSTVAWNWFVLVFPDLEMGENSRFALKNLSSQDARLILIEVEADPLKEKQSKLFSPATIGRLLKG